MLEQTPDVRKLNVSLFADLGDSLRHRGDLAGAREAHDRALRIGRERGNDRAVAVSLGQLGAIALAANELDEAKARYQEARTTFQAMGEPQSVAISWHQLGVVYQRQGQWGRAEHAFRVSARLKEEPGDAGDACREACVLVLLKTSANWTFVDFAANTTQCPFDFGFYVAFYRDVLAGTDASMENASFGFFEASTYRSFDAYMSQVLALNQSWDYRFDKINVYQRPTGGRVTFILNTDDKQWGIVDYDDGAGIVEPERRFDKWPVAAGDLMSAPREGCIVVENRKLQQRLILDHTDVKRPKRTIIALPGRECTCPLPDYCISPRGD